MLFAHSCLVQTEKSHHDITEIIKDKISSKLMYIIMVIPRMVKKIIIMVICILNSFKFGDFEWKLNGGNQDMKVLK